jgi:hypothetical protein
MGERPRAAANQHACSQPRMNGQDIQVGRSDGPEAQIAVKPPWGGSYYTFRCYDFNRNRGDPAISRDVVMPKGKD